MSLMILIFSVEARHGQSSACHDPILLASQNSVNVLRRVVSSVESPSNTAWTSLYKRQSLEANFYWKIVASELHMAHHACTSPLFNNVPHNTVTIYRYPKT